MSRNNKLCATRIDILTTSDKILRQYPVSVNIAKHVQASRQRIEKIIRGKDKRLLVIIGPCSIHDLDSSMEYAHRLLFLRKKYQSHLEIVMRTYFEKPRSVTGWKGFVFDPDLNGSYRVNHGIKLARRLLLQINELKLPTATEFLDIVIGRFISDLISWGAIGARTTESPIHREIASALSCPIGFKNGTDGNINIAINAIRSARTSHIFLSPNINGQITIYKTRGNSYSHIIMRGGKRPNYYANDINIVCNTLHKFRLPEHLMIDFSHGNCQKQPRRQLEVCDDVCKQIRNGSTAISGVMIESFLVEGRQKIVGEKPIIYGQSITDPCLGWKESELLLEKLSSAIESRF